MRLNLESAIGGTTRQLAFESSEVVWIGRSSHCQLRIGLEHSEVSRRHAELRWSAEGWVLQDHSKSGTYINGERLGSTDPIQLHVGDIITVGPLVIQIKGLGRGLEQTVAPSVTIASASFHTLSAKSVLDSTVKLTQLCAGAQSEAELFQRACDYLVEVLSPAVTSAYVVETSPVGACASTLVAKCSTNDETAPILSQRIISDASKNEDAVVFFHHDSLKTIQATVSAETRAAGAFLIEHSPSGAPVVMYVLGEGRLVQRQDLAAEYLTLVSTLTRQQLAALRRTSMTKYFSPRVVELLMRRGGQVRAEAEPRVTKATSFFFDLRGFSLSVEASANDLFQLRRILQKTMDIVTQEVFARDGTVIDYQGDSCFAAWGVPFDQPDQVQSAVDTALRIIGKLSHVSGLRAGADAVCGIGIAHGEVLSGSVGSHHVFKYGMLGPSVNAAARLEALTKPKYLNAPLLVTEEVIQQLERDKTPYVRAARVQLAGTATDANIYEVLSASRPLAETDNASRWEALLSALEAARNPDALKEILTAVPQTEFRSDPRAIWLTRFCKHLESHPQALENWDGLVRYGKD